MSSQDVISYKQRIPAHVRNAINRLNPAIADRVFYYLAKKNQDPKTLTQETVGGWIMVAQKQYEKAISIPMDIQAVTASMIEFESGEFVSSEELVGGI